MKTTENNKCRKCNGIGKPSKGYVNFHNIRTMYKEDEFETKLLNCLKCEKCGNSWIPETDTNKINKRLEYLRQELEAERISYGELAELQSLADHIDKNDVQLLEAAGVPENLNNKND